MQKLLVALLALCIAVATAYAAAPLNDTQLEQISGGDGISFAMHLALNDPTLSAPSIDSRLSLGFNVNGQNNYLVIKNLHGTVDMFALGLDMQKKPDGTDYLALTLPSYVRYGNFGFDSLSAQVDPSAPVTGSLGSFNLNGTLSMQGQFRMWAH